MSVMDEGVLMAGFARGKTDTLYQAMMMEIAAHREHRVMEGAYAANDRDMNQAMGAVKALDDLKEKMEVNVEMAQEKLRAGEEKGEGKGA